MAVNVPRGTLGTRRILFCADACELGMMAGASYRHSLELTTLSVRVSKIVPSEPGIQLLW